MMKIEVNGGSNNDKSDPKFKSLLESYINDIDAEIDLNNEEMQGIDNVDLPQEGSILFMPTEKTKNSSRINTLNISNADKSKQTIKLYN